ncbi:MAG: antibiotic biosynthesis monooxygenase [Trueperaceae bacterium]
MTNVQNPETVASIRKEAKLVTVLYIMTVDPDDQDTLVQHVKTIYALLTKEPGYISLTILRSLDGLRVATYEQWESEARMNAAKESHNFQKGLTKLQELVIEGEPRIYDVRHIGHLQPNEVTVIQPGKGMAAFNEVTTTPEKQEELLRFMIGVDGNAQRQAGYVSTNIHASCDGVRILNYVQFENKDIMLSGLEKVMSEVMKERSDVNLNQVAGLGTTDLHLFEVVMSYYKSYVWEAAMSKAEETAVQDVKPQQSEVQERLTHLQSKLTPATKDSIDTVFAIAFTDDKQHYTIDARRGVGQGLLAGAPETHGLSTKATISTSSSDFVKLVSGQLMAPIAVMSGRLKVKGNPKDLPKLVPLFG